MNEEEINENKDNVKEEIKENNDDNEKEEIKENNDNEKEDIKNNDNNEKILDNKTEESNERKSENPIIEKIDEKEEKLINENNQKKEKKRYFGIDLIRVIACYFVIVTHAGETYYIGGEGFSEYTKTKKSIWGGISNSLVRSCVPLFVMISGYLLLPMKSDYITFLKKRFTRIFFPFFLFCIFYDIYYCIKGDFGLKQMFINIPKIFINYGTEVGHLWYIYMAMGIYLFIPIISPWIKTAKKEHFYYYFAIWSISLFNHYIHFIYDEVWGESYWNNTSLFQSFIGDFGYAVLGAFIKLHLKEYNLYITGIILYVIGSVITMLGFILQRNTAKDCKEIEMTLNYNTINVAMSSFGIFLLLRKIEIKNKIVCLIINDIALKSYGMYLIHIFFLTLFRSVLDTRNQHPGWCIHATAFLTFICSYISVKLLSLIPYSEFIIG